MQGNRSRFEDIARLRRVQPLAEDILYDADHRCPIRHCKQYAMYSYRLPGDPAPDAKGNEACGFWCASCGWGNGGSRPTLDGGK